MEITLAFVIGLADGSQSPPRKRTPRSLDALLTIARGDGAPDPTADSQSLTAAYERGYSSHAVEVTDFDS